LDFSIISEKLSVLATKGGSHIFREWIPGRRELCSYDDILETNYFQVMDIKVPVNGEDISDALRRLPKKKKPIELLP